MKRTRPALLFALVVVLAACSPQAGPRSPDSVSAGRDGPPATRKTAVTLGVTAQVSAMSIAADSSTSGGWQDVSEVYANGLMTADVHTQAPVGRLVERLPTLADGSMAILTDGRMRVAYRLRSGITWQDGTPFTARDMAFSYRMLAERGLPAVERNALTEMDAVEAADDTTFVVHFKGPYYLADSIGLRLFWPHPQHILGDAFERYQADKDTQAFLNLPYWTTEYVHLGPFRLRQFDPGEAITFAAYEQYFLGRPKVDVVHIRTINDPNTLLANLLAGTVDLFPTAALNDEPALQLKARWEASGEGKVHLVPGGNERYVVPQYRPEFQAEPASLDIRVRTALSYAIDREALAEAMHSRGAAITSILPPGSRSYEASKDALRPYGYDLDRARALLQEAGWAPGPDGVLRSEADGRRFRTTLWVAGGGPKEISIIADYWSQVGVDVEMYDVPVAQSRDRRFRSTFPGWENSSGDALSIMKGPVTSAENNWSGHRAGYVNPLAEELVNTYYRSISVPDQLRAAKAMSDMFARDLPMLLLYYRVRYVGARASVKALDDFAGSGEIQLGSTMRNAHLWEVRSP